MGARPYRIYFRPHLLFSLVVLSLVFLATMLVLAILVERDRENLNLILPGLVLFVLAYYVRRATLSWLRISEDGKEIVKVPSWFERRITGERQRVTEIPPGSELLFCRQFGYGALNGYFIILCAPDGARTILWSAARGANRRWWARVADEVQKGTPLKARLATQTLSTDGLQETEWTPESRRIPWKNFVIVVPLGLSPFLGGLVRYFTARPSLIGGWGVLIWLVGAGTAWRLSRSVPRRVGPSTAIMLVAWTMEFFVFYLAAALVVGAIIGR